MIKNITLRLIALAVLVAAGLNLRAQDISISVEGKVTDEYGRPMNGVIVTSENGKNGTSTNINGEYTLMVGDNSKLLVFSYPGHRSEKVEIGEGKSVDSQLKFDAHLRDDKVQLGYTEERREVLTGAVSTVTGEELERSPVANLTQTLAGRLNGLTTWEAFSELSRAQTNIFVRGFSAARGNGPLVMIDGIINSYNSNQTLEYISANEIESITILKDASTQALYGIQGANGLLVVKTKRGVKGGLKIKTRFDQSFQQVANKPPFFSSLEYAQMRNQAAENDGLGPNYLFTEAQIEGFRAGTDAKLYPNNNWYKQYFKDFAQMQRAAVNVTGGNDRVQFFSNINFMHQGGQFKTDQTRYNPNANNIWINYRTNIDMNLNRYLKAFIRLSGNVKRERTPGASNADVYNSFFLLPPTMYGPVTPEVLSASGEVVDPGGNVVTTERVAAPTYGMLNRTGYRRHTVTNITSQFGLDLDMGFLTKGLNLSGVMAYQTNSVGSLSTTQNYERYVRTNDANTLSFVKKGSDNNTPLAYSKSHSYYYHLTYNLALNYNRAFGKHNIGAMAYMFYQNLTKADVVSPQSLPYNRVSSGFEANYGFDNRYLLKFDVGYSGSEQYARGSRYTTTPAIAAAWVISNEEFLKNSNVLSFLKLRASYGKTANDQSGLARYAYLDNVTVGGGGPIGYLQYLVTERQRGNPNIRAEISTKQNFGIDLGFLKSINLSVDVFQEKMNNMVVSAISTIPSYQGIPLSNYPQTNSGKFENKGVEVNLNYNKMISKDLTLTVGAMAAYAKNKIISWNEAQKTDDYAFRKWQEGYSYGQAFGYLVDYSNGNGFFNSQAEIDQSNLEYGFGTPRPGDLKFRDLNGDSKIDERDKAPIGHGALPRLTYAFNGSVKYKGFDFSVLVQGVGQFNNILMGQGIMGTDYDGVFNSLHRQAWTPERYASGEAITSPALSLAKTVNTEANDYYAYNSSYVRLRNLEIGYTLPYSVSRGISAEKLRILVSGQNLITWDKMKSKDFGPESTTFTNIPVYRVFNVGINVIF